MVSKKGRPHKLNLVGQKFNEWTVISHPVGGHSLCRCSCGVEKTIQTGTLTRGASLSCGCKGKDWCRRHGMEGTSTYNIWAGVKARCTKPTSAAYINYGAKGIKICDRWLDFVNFFEDMGERPEGMSLDRINTFGDYSPENCRWADHKTQCRNKRKTVYLEHNGEKRPMAEWAELNNLPRKTLEDRIRKGWSIKDALERPNRYRKRK